MAFMLPRGGAAHFHDPFFVRASGEGYPRWQMDGADRARSNYDAELGAIDSNVNRQLTSGWLRLAERLKLSAPTMTRGNRIAAQQNSIYDSPFFQSYTGAGTGRNWSGGMVASTKRFTHQSFNPNMQGAAELHPATSYDPFPAPGSLYPKVV